MRALRALNLVARLFQSICARGAFAYLRLLKKTAARSLKRLISLRFSKKLSLDRLDDCLRREIFHAGVGA